MNAPRTSWHNASPPGGVFIHCNGKIYSSKMDRDFDILKLEPSDRLSQNDIEAARLVRFAQYNPQGQPPIEWPAGFPVVRSYLDQLARGKWRRDVGGDQGAGEGNQLTKTAR